jgi:tRNA threonylcarbamoyladenosine biosynthesis protein TsaB
MADFNDKPILAFDCSTPQASVALAVGGTVFTRALAQGQQAALLVPAIQDVLNEGGVAYKELAAIVTTTGPGSFTGLRIALATLHGLVLAHGTPIRLLTAPQAVAFEINQPHFHVALNAGKGELFVQSFSGTAPTGDIRLVKPAELADLPDCYGHHVGVDHPHYRPGPQAATLCSIAPQLPAATLAEAMPHYIRPPDAKTSAPPPWLQTT